MKKPAKPETFAAACAVAAKDPVCYDGGWTSGVGSARDKD